jgi:hypothetical protein
MEETFRIVWNNGKTETHPTYVEAMTAVGLAHDAVVIGHSGDIADGGLRTLFWATQADAENDAGAKALGRIEKWRQPMD